MPASSIMKYFDDCETDGLSSSSCTFFNYTTIRKIIVITNVAQKCISYLLINFITCNYDFFPFNY